MAKFDYDEVANVALESISDFGGYAELLVNEAVATTDEWDVPNPDLWVPYATQAVLLPLGASDIAYLAGSTAVETMSKMLVEAVTLTNDIKVNYRIKYKDETWIIKSIKPLKPSDTNILWTVYVGK